MSAKSRLRNRTGTLYLYKKKAWKNYLFKVTANTYFHYFKDQDMSKPVGQILLADVSRVGPAFMKDASFAFEVHFRGKGSSPWVLNSTTNEDRIQWMDTILPGSSTTLSAVQHITPRPTSPLPQSPAQLSPPDQSPSHVQRPQSPSLVQRPPSPNPTNSLPPHRPRSPLLTKRNGVLSAANIDLTQSWPLTSPPGPQMTFEPQEYLMPVATHPQVRPTRSSPVPSPTPRPRNLSQPPERTSNSSRPGKPTPMKRSTVSGVSQKPPEPPPRPFPKTRTAPNLEVLMPPEASEQDPYVIMQPSPIRKRSHKFPSPSSVPSMQEVPTDMAEYLDLCPDYDQPGELDLCPVDENNYVLPTQPVTRSVKPSFVARRGSENGLEGGGGGGRNVQLQGMVDQMATSFSPAQLDLLVTMLTQVQGVGRQQTDEEVAAAWDVPSETKSRGEPSTGPQPAVKSLMNRRGNLERALSTTPSLDPYNILITDDDESYEPRPEWAKAATLGNGQDHAALDTLTALEQEALLIPRADLDAFEQIGEGQFGKVFKATLKRGSTDVPVAVKTTKKTTSDAEKASFVQEMSVMSQMMHPNIVRLYGLVSEEVPSPWIVLEYLPHGDLKSFLKKNQRPVKTLCKYMIDVAMGMHYISERGLVHRDLAARNILVGENELCKVADFGLLRELPKDDSIYHSQTNVPCPVRWMPPEAVTDRAFSTASDVWSFGILQWEMFNPTKLPYEKFSNLEVVTKVMQGYRLPVPRDCPPIVARIMKACWHQSPSKRPSFLLISTLLSTKVTFDQ